MTLYLDKEHGVNPSLDQCFYCMKDKGVILFGRLKRQAKEAFRESGLSDGSGKAPHKICLNKEPCDECQGHMTAGVILISVDEALSPDLQNPYRTGGWVVVKESMIERTFQPSELVEDILKRRIAFMPDDAWDELGLPRGE